MNLLVRYKLKFNNDDLIIYIIIAKNPKQISSHILSHMLYKQYNKNTSSVTTPLSVMAVVLIFYMIAIMPASSLSTHPTYTPLGANIMQVGSREVVVDNTSINSGIRNFSVTFSQAISNPKLVLGNYILNI